MERRVLLPPLTGAVMRLRGFVDDGSPSGTIRELPFVGTPMVLSFGAPYRLSEVTDPDRPIRVMSHFLAGLSTGYSTSESTGPGWSIQLDLAPLGAFQVLAVPLHELTDRAVPFEELVGSPGRRLVGSLEQSTTWRQRFDLVEQFLVEQLASAPCVPGEVQWAWQHLTRSRGTASIGELAEEVGWSRRHLASRFREHVGLPPKRAARLIRFDAARALLVTTANTLAEIAADLNYSDQAHLSRELRTFAGTTPLRLRNLSAHAE